MSKKEPAPSDLADKFMLRLPEGMRHRIRIAAEENNRSMNAEIVATLAEKYPLEDPLEEQLDMVWHNLTMSEKEQLIDLIKDYHKNLRDFAGV